MKSPPVQHPDALAHDLTEDFISGASAAALTGADYDASVETETTSA
jgi:hypothetical protein